MKVENLRKKALSSRLKTPRRLVMEREVELQRGYTTANRLDRTQYCVR
jgi:hypothetical protein